MTIYKNGQESPPTAGDTAFTATEASVLFGSTNPAPFGAGGGRYAYTETVGSSGYQRWALDSQAAWQFRRLIYISAQPAVDLDFIATRTGGDAATGMLVRANANGELRVVGAGGVFAFTSTGVTIPTAGWYRLEGYGNGVNNTARIALFDPASNVPRTGMDTGTISVPQGGTAPTSVRVGKTSLAAGYAGRVAWDLDEFRTGTHASSAFLGPYTAALSLSGAVTPGDPRILGTLLTLTLTASGGNGNPLSYSGTWDGTSFGPQASNVVTHTDQTAGVKNWSATVSQPD